MSKVRVRFAPSPTGFLHVGGARTALFNWLFARHSGGSFILRIEDTDSERSKPEYEEAILRDLKWLGLDWDEGPLIGGSFGPYAQAQRGSFYQTELNRLLSLGHAYYCFCTPLELEAERSSIQASGKSYRYSGKCRSLTNEQVADRRKAGQLFSIRFKVPVGSTSFNDLIRGRVKVEHSEIDDFILVRTGGDPTYNLVAAVDDALMKISHVIRGDDHISNTPKQILINQALGFSLPEFAHIPLILGTDRTPLSKRHGANSVGEFKRKGYLPETMLNYLALLGWSFDGKSEIFSQEELIQKFSLDRVVKSAACFDYDKLQWLNGHYIRLAHEERIYRLCLEYLLESGLINEEFLRQGDTSLKRMVKAVKSSLKTISEVGEQLTYFLGEVQTYDSAALEKYSNPQYISILDEASHLLEQWGDQNASILEEKFRQNAIHQGKKFGEYVHPMRLAITGRTHSPNLFEIIEILGNGRCVARLKRFIQVIKDPKTQMKEDP